MRSSGVYKGYLESLRALRCLLLQPPILKLLRRPLLQLRLQYLRQLFQVALSLVQVVRLGNAPKGKHFTLRRALNYKRPAEKWPF